MSGKCSDCDCSNPPTGCTKKSSYSLVIVETEKSYVDAVVMDAPAAEHNGKCKCGASCACTNCTCGQ